MSLKVIRGNALLFLIFGLWAMSPVEAQDSQVRLQTVVQPREVAAGDIFVVNIEVSSDEMVNVETPTPPQINGATFRGRQQFQRTNAGAVMNASGEVEFRRSVTQVFTFQYVADKTGPLVVPSITVTVDGKAQRTSVAQIQVLPSGARPSRSAQQPRSARPDFFDEEEDPFAMSNDPFESLRKAEEQFNRILRRQFGGLSGGTQFVPDFDEKDAFVIVAEVDKTEAFEGEQITATWYLYTKAGVREIDTLKYPDLKGFWKEDIELATLLNFQPAQLNGQPYNRALLASYALFPIEEGGAKIDSYKAKVTVVSAFGKGITGTKTSKEIPILVKPLPEAGKPASFSGAVGEFQIKAQIEGTSVVANQPFVMRVHVEGRGNAKQFELPNPTLPTSVEIYDIKKDSKFFKNGMSYKTFEIAMIPREAGELVIPPIVTSVFNPRTQKYEELQTEEFKLTVIPGAGQQSLAASRLQKEGASGADQESLQVLSEWTPQEASARPSGLIWAVSFAALFFGLFGYASVALHWFRKPLGMREHYQIRLKRMNKITAQKKWRELGVEATNLSAYVLGQISGQGGAHLQTEKLLEKASPSVRRQLGAELQKVLEKFYFLGFGPEELALKSVDENKVIEDVKNLEKLLWKSIELSETDAKV